jgi:segregation and condensation protein B
MPPTPDPPFESQPQGISLNELAEAFAQVMGTEPRRPKETAATKSGDSAAAQPAESSKPAADAPTPEKENVNEEDNCPISPRSILEAMLFVGNRENRPLTPGRAAELMRDVAIDEIPTIVDALNKRYAASGAPYRIAGEGDGYCMTLCHEFSSLRNAFYGRVREARLSQAAIDVLSLVAYQQPITSQKVGRLRGKPSNHILASLVHRGLLKIERPDPKCRTPHYRTTDRFLQLFNLQSLDDLPRSEDATPP